MENRVVRAGIRGDGRRALNAALNNRQTFETSGALRGLAMDSGRFGFTGPGQLKHGDLNQWIADRARATFVVFSYTTPIAWVVEDRVYFVAQRFSTTTSKHQGALWPLDREPGYFARA